VRSSPDAAEEVSLVESVTRFSPRRRPGGGVAEVRARNRPSRGLPTEATVGSSHRRLSRPLRLAQYGPDGGPSRGLASGRAVSCFDYSWELTRVDEAERVLGGADLRRAGAA